MRGIYQVLILLKNFATGIMAPVLTLTLIARGTSLGGMSLLIGTYSLTVIAMEFPSGVYADLRGRKRAFLISAALYGLGYGLILLAHATAALFCAMVLCGLGRAFSSGSIEALALDEAEGDDGALVRAATRLSILESAGLAAGSLVGGLLAGASARYSANLIANLSLYAALFLLALFLVREAPRAAERGTGLARAGSLVKDSLRFMAAPGAVRMLFFMALFTGFALVSVETYWQSALQALSPDAWMLGLVSFAGFFSVMLGSKLAERRLARRPEALARLLLWFKAGLGAGLILLAPQTRAPLFALVYALIYLVLGAGGVAENALINREACAGQRASVLSLFSFILQIGGLIASACGYAVSARADFRTMWWISGALLLLGSGVFAALRARKHSEHAAITSGRGIHDTK